MVRLPPAGGTRTEGERPGGRHYDSALASRDSILPLLRVLDRFEALSNHRMNISKDDDAAATPNSSLLQIPLYSKFLFTPNSSLLQIPIYSKFHFTLNPFLLQNSTLLQIPDKNIFQWEFIFVRHYVRMWFTSCMIVGLDR